jgi:hypothetical protein
MAMGVRCRKVHACLKGVPSIAVSIGLILAITALLWEIKSTTSGSYGLVYVYLFPVSLIAALYNGPLAVLSAAVAHYSAPTFSSSPRSIVLSMTILWNMATLLLSRYWLSRRSSSFEKRPRPKAPKAG